MGVKHAIEMERSLKPYCPEFVVSPLQQECTGGNWYSSGVSAREKSGSVGAVSMILHIDEWLRALSSISKNVLNYYDIDMLSYTRAIAESFWRIYKHKGCQTTP